MCKIAELLKAIGASLRAMGPFFPGLIALLIALFLDDYRRWRYKPKLEVSANDSPPCCVRKTHMPVGTGWAERPHYALGVRVTNFGNAEARDVEVYATSLEIKNGRGKFEPVSGFAGTNLVWSLSQQHTLGLLNPRMPKFFNLARVFCKDEVPKPLISHIGPPTMDYLGDRTIFDFAPQVGSWGQIFAPGIYRLTIMLGAANVKPIKKILQIKVTGNWPGVEPQMVSQVLEVKVL